MTYTPQVGDTVTTRTAGFDPDAKWTVEDADRPYGCVGLVGEPADHGICPYIYVHRDTLTPVAPPLPPEPKMGSVVLAQYGFAYQRGPNCWYRTSDISASYSWADIAADAVPLLPVTADQVVVERADLAALERNVRDYAHGAPLDRIGAALCSTAFVPAHFKGKPEEAAAAILYGDEIGLTPTAALQNVYVIGGKPALYARIMVALVLAAGHEVWTESKSDEKVTVCGRRHGSDHIITEIAREILADEPDPERVVDELLDLAAAALLWVEAIT